MNKCHLARFRKPARALFAATLVMTLGACNLRTEDEMMEDRVQRAEAAAKKALAAQQAAEEALEKIRMDVRDRSPVDDEQQRDEQDGSSQTGDSSQPEA